MKYSSTLFSIFSILAQAFPCSLSAADARVWEDTLVIPAYEVGSPDTNPRSNAGRAYQEAQGKVYPNLMFDAVYLENEYVDVCNLPDAGVEFSRQPTRTITRLG